MNWHVVELLTPACITVVVFSFAGLACWGIRRRQPMNLSNLIMRSVAAAGIPTALALIWCAYCPRDLPKLADYELHIAVAGMSLLYCSILAMLRG